MKTIFTITAVLLTGTFAVWSGSAARLGLRQSRRRQHAAQLWLDQP